MQILTDNQPHHPHQTSWGVSTRLIGGIIMTHGDDNGLVLPPRVAPIQAVVLPIAQHKEGVIEAAQDLKARLEAAGVRVKLDDSDKAPGWKFAEYEMRGVPLRVEIGPKDMEKGQCCIARRDTGEKTFVPLAELERTVAKLLDSIHDNMFAMAKKNLEDNTFTAETWEQVKELVEKDHGGFVHTKWCGSLECELAMKEKAGVRHLLCEPKQMVIDGDFPTVKSPNPENPEGFYLAVDLARENGVDFILGTDPDSDRVGIMVRDKEGAYQVITGNQTGVVLLDYMLEIGRAHV